MTRPLGFGAILILISTSAWITSCTNNKSPARENEITRVVLATGGCFGPCPVQIFDIDSSLSVKYVGEQNTDLKGFHRGKIPQEFWDSLNIKFESVSYKKLDSAYDETADGLTTELMIYDENNRIKYIYAQSSSLPDSVENVYKWLLARLDKIRLTKTDDSLLFPQYRGRPRIRNIIKFLPPKVDFGKETP
jgi:hypothetical protein